MADVWRRYWPLHLVALGFFAVVLIFTNYLSARQHTADLRDQRTRQSLCAILDRIPEHIDSGMDKARKLDRCGEPHPPSVFFGHPFPTPNATVTVRPTPAPGSTVLIQPRPTTTVTTKPAPSPRPTPPSPRPSQTPRPSPSPTCFDGTGLCLPPHIG